MNLFFESRSCFHEFSGDLRGVQHRPTVHPEPVLVGDSPCDGRGVSIYGTVLRDGGRLRMWYMARSSDSRFSRKDTAAVGYAESSDGLAWHKPNLGTAEAPHNICNFGLHCPSLFIDPEAPPSHRFRGSGYGSEALILGQWRPPAPGYYTMHSPNGVEWKPDMEGPRWPAGDVITSIYHPGRRSAVVAMKIMARRGGIFRRSIHIAEGRRGIYGSAVSALYPDEYDDLLALQRGYAGSDYYGMGMMPAGQGTVGFLWNYWHGMPYSSVDPAGAGFSDNVGLYGVSDISLVYQDEANGHWAHMNGRPPFIDREAREWTRGWVHTASAPVEVGDEHWLYFTGVSTEHGYYLNPDWSTHAGRAALLEKGPRSQIGLIRWPKYRLFGLESSREGALTVKLPATAAGCALVLNYATRLGGTVRVEVPGCPGFGAEDCEPLCGDAISEPLRWKGGTRLPSPPPGLPLRIRLHLERATVYAYDTLSQ